MFMHVQPQVWVNLRSSLWLRVLTCEISKCASPCLCVCLHVYICSFTLAMVCVCLQWTWIPQSVLKTQGCKLCQAEIPFNLIFPQNISCISAIVANEFCWSGTYWKPLYSWQEQTKVFMHSQTHAHHESRDVCLCGVWGQVDFLGGTTLVLGIHHHTVACEAFKASKVVFLTRHSPVHSERGRADLGELEVGGGWDGWRKERKQRWGERETVLTKGDAQQQS